jgi:hypothetical protein
MTALKNMLLGTNAENEKFYLSIEYSQEYRESLNIKHERLTHYTRVSFAGTLISKYGSIIYNRGFRSGGQNMDELLNITKPAKGYTLESIKEIYRIWNEYHLNDCNSHCEHQDKAVKWDEVAHCPVTGYKAGSNWLVREITPTELDAIVAAVIPQKKAVSA